MYADVNCAGNGKLVKDPLVNNAGTLRAALAMVALDPDEGLVIDDFPRMHLTANLDVFGSAVHDQWRGTKNEPDTFAWDCAAAEAEAQEAGE